jgi:arylsulfatase A-like enzyme
MGGEVSTLRGRIEVDIISHAVRPAPRFVSGLMALLALGSALAALALCAACADPPKEAPHASLAAPSTRPYNLLLITLDTTRADRLGCYGYTAGRTPRLDLLARAGARFDRAYTPAVLTLPSHATILTGTYPTFHQLHYNGTFRLGDSAVTLAELCKRAGFATAASVGGYVLHSQFGLNQGFDEYFDRFVASDRRAADVTSDAIGFIDRHAGQRMFLWAHYYDPHFPREPPEEFARQFPNDGYDGEVAYMDSQIGRLLDALDRHGLSDHTLVVVVADHGEGLLEHEPTHGIFLYEPTVRVPLILNAPGRVPARVIDAVVSTVDILPTVCELLHVPASPDCQGASLTGLMNGRDEASRQIYLESYGPRQMYGWSELLGVRSGSWKYIRAPRAELYDVSHDPGETKNLIDGEAKTARALSADLDRMIARVSKAAPPAGVPLRPEDAEKLAQLGYAQGNLGTARGKTLVDPKDRVEVLYLHRNAAALAPHDRNAAIAAYKAILARYPDEPRALSAVAELLAQAGRIDEAIACYRRVIELRADSVVPQRSLAFLYFQKNDLVNARKAVDAALRIQPVNNQSHMILSLILSASGKSEEALAEIDKSLAIDAHYDAALLQRASLLTAVGRTEEALRTLESIDPSSPNRYAALGDALRLYEAAHRTDAVQRVQAEMSALKAQGKAGGRRVTLVGGGY